MPLSAVMIPRAWPSRSRAATGSPPRSSSNPAGLDTDSPPVRSLWVAVWTLLVHGGGPDSSASCRRRRLGIRQRGAGRDRPRHRIWHSRSDRIRFSSSSGSCSPICCVVVMVYVGARVVYALGPSRFTTHMGSRQYFRPRSWTRSAGACGCWPSSSSWRLRSTL